MKHWAIAFTVLVLFAGSLYAGDTDDFDKSLNFETRTHFRSKRFYDYDEDVTYGVIERFDNGTLDDQGRWKPGNGSDYQYEYFMEQGCRAETKKVNLSGGGTANRTSYRATVISYYQTWGGQGKMIVRRFSSSQKAGICQCTWLNPPRGIGYGNQNMRTEQKIVIREPEKTSSFVALMKRKTAHARWRNNSVWIDGATKHEACGERPCSRNKYAKPEDKCK